MPKIEALKNIPASMVGGSSRLGRGERADVTKGQAERLTGLGYAERIGGERQPQVSEDLEDLTVDELEAKAKEMDLSGYSSLKKAELIGLIKEESK